MKTLQEITDSLSALETRANEALASVEAGNQGVEEAKALIAKMKPEMDALSAEREARIRRTMDDVRAQLRQSTAPDPTPH